MRKFRPGMEKRDLAVKHKGTLFLVGTPLGNLKDITLRALETLQNVDLIAAEDTRQTQKLLNHYQLKKPLTSYYEHNKQAKEPYLLAQLTAGQNIALVSDAGLPGISDPGEDLVKACHREKIAVRVIPGPTAFLAALLAAGLPSRSFTFIGFLPSQKKARVKLLQELKWETRTIIFYEAPHRLSQTLQEIREIWGERFACLARELTKIHEEYLRGTLSELLEYGQKHSLKGEITLLLTGAQTVEKKEIPPEEIMFCYFYLIKKGLTRQEALKETTALLGVARREVYNLLLQNKNETP